MKTAASWAVLTLLSWFVLGFAMWPLDAWRFTLGVLAASCLCMAHERLEKARAAE